MEKSNSFNKIAFLFILGITGCALAFIGSAFSACYSSISLPSDMVFDTSLKIYADILSGSQQISESNIILSAFFLLIGLPLSAFGFYAVLKLTDTKRKILPGIYKWSLLTFVSVVAACHVIFTISMYIWKIFVSEMAGNRISMISDFANTFLFPVAFIMLISYFVLSVTAFILVVIKATSLPRFFVAFNPLVIIAIIFGLNFLIPGVPLWNVIKSACISSATLVFTASSFIHFLVHKDVL